MKEKVIEHLLSAYGHISITRPLVDIYFRSLTDASKKLYVAMNELYSVIDDVARCMVIVDKLDPRGEDHGRAE